MAITKIGTPELFDFSATNTALQLPTGDTASRPATPSTGEWRFNSQLKYVEFWDSTAWRQIDTESAAVFTAAENFNTNTYFGTGATQPIDAKFKEAANFNGSSSKIDLPDLIGDAMGDNNFSVSFWVYVNSTSSDEIILNISKPNNFYVRNLSSGNIYIELGGVNGFDTGVSLSTGWHHIAVTKSSTAGLVLYIDNSANTFSTKTANLGANSVTNTIGNYNGGYVVDGKIDQVRIFTTALSAVQAEDLFTDETTTTAAILDFPAGAGCIAAYQLDGNGNDISTNYNGTTTDIGYTGLEFQPDLVWIKQRSAPNRDHMLFDSVRGPSTNPNFLYSNLVDPESTGAAEYLSSFNNNGFTVGNSNYTGASGEDYVAWCWKAAASNATNNEGNDTSIVRANKAAGFSMVKYTGPGVLNPGHGLDVPPNLIIAKGYSATEDWYVYNSISGTGKYLSFTRNDTGNGVGNDGIQTRAASFSTVSSTSFTTNVTSATLSYIAYCFANISGYQRVGTYVGNQTTNRRYTTDDDSSSGANGFSPRFLLIKSLANGYGWLLYDNLRLVSVGSNAGTLNARPYLLPNLVNGENGSTSENINFNSDGFTLTGSAQSVNDSGVTYLYLAIA